MTAEAFAPAKINLTLHVTGQREDGYHVLDSLVVFADIGDTVTAAPSPSLSLEITGPESRHLTAGDDNLVLRAARLFAAPDGARITLTKRLPLASGIGGGSSDAAATLRALAQLWALPLPAAQHLLTLGADIPVCLSPSPQRMRGIGDVLTPAGALPQMDIVLVNPRVAVATPEVFAALAQKSNPPMAESLPAWRDPADFSGWLSQQRNDLLPPALALQPVVSDVLAAIRTSGSLFAGMSGSGATCFGLFPADGRSAAAAAAAITERSAGRWWCRSGRLLA